MNRHLLLATLCLAGCAVGPNFKPPQPRTMSDWVDTPSPQTSATRVSTEVHPQGSAAENWWSSFNDPQLSSLIDRALKSNYALHDAMLRIAQARALRDIQAAARWPALSLGGSYARQRISETTAAGALLGSPQPAVPGTDNPFDQYQVGFDASWEIDLFGRVRRSVEAANADTQSAVETGHDVLLSLLGDVARAYIELRGEQLQFAISKENLRNQREVLELTRDRRSAGTGNDLDVANAAAQVATTEALLPRLQRQIEESINQLSLLLALQPAALRSELSAAAAVPPPPPQVPVDLPATLARRRPDIRRAEANLHAATARVGVATADLFPRITLNANLGAQSERAADLDDWASRFSAISPRIDLPILDGGRRRATVRLESLRLQETALAYEQTVLAALHEAQNALTAFSTEQDRRASLEAAVGASRDALNLSQLRYRSGVIGFLDVLDAERNLQQSELALAQSSTAVSTNLVAVYKALGGGWETPAATLEKVP